MTGYSAETPWTPREVTSEYVYRYSMQIAANRWLVHSPMKDGTVVPGWREQAMRLHDRWGQWLVDGEAKEFGSITLWLPTPDKDRLFESVLWACQSAHMIEMAHRPILRGFFEIVEGEPWEEVPFLVEMSMTSNDFIPHEGNVGKVPFAWYEIARLDGSYAREK